MSGPYTIQYRGKSYSCREGETLLDAMLRQGVDFPFSCRSGTCHVCMHRVEQGEVDERAQRGLSETQREQNLFLPCRCSPQGDMAITSRDEEPKGCPAAVAATSSPPAPDPEMWQALEEGKLLTEILDDFYSQVYEDERLSPFFEGVTKQRAIEKQFLFLRQMFTGEKVYFGDRPRNAHHWMVISNELFDYREGLMLATLRRHGLPEHLVKRWQQLEERFRGDIVKDTPWKRKMGDIELPVEGYDELTMDVGSICDSCGAEIEAGQTVRYHVRLGHIYCSDCMEGGKAA